ncbi:MAG: hypothetical protein R3B99_13445 [Polyangiales bacterium]
MPDVVEEGPQTDGLETVRDSRATSTGWPWSGRLLDAVRLQPTEHVHLVDADVPAGRHYGTVELVGLIGRVAAHVAHAAPGAGYRPARLSGEPGSNIPAIVRTRTAATSTSASTSWTPRPASP